MRRIYTAAQAAAIDKFSIEKTGIPGIVLMERAALSVTGVVLETLKEMNKEAGRVLCVCGHGNNGADAVATARQLNEKGIQADIYPAGDSGKGTEEFKLQISIAENLGINILEKTSFDECVKGYDVIVDGIFGNGLERDVTGKYADIIRSINGSDVPVISIDIPSGTDATTGRTLGVSVTAHITVTFGALKCGLVFLPGAQNAGKIVVSDIGFDPVAEAKTIAYREKLFYLLDADEIKNIHKRETDSHKGTYGRVLIVAGSLAYGGAAVLSAKAALRTGAGIVKVFTHEENRDVLIASVPEAIPVVYDDPEDEEEFKESLDLLAVEAAAADVVVLGPGLDTDETAQQIAHTVFVNVKGILIADADGLNIVSEINVGEGRAAGSFAPKAKAVIITPHIGEASRLLGRDKELIKEDPCGNAAEASFKYKCVTVLKGARTVISGFSDRFFINAKGNPGMATAGSGDVLTGVIAGLAAMESEDIKNRPVGEVKSIAERVAYTGVYVHACAGDGAAKEKGEHSLIASDIVEKLSCVLNDV